VGILRNKKYRLSITKVPTRKYGVFPSLRDAKAQGKPSLRGAKFWTRGHPGKTIKKNGALERAVLNLDL
jgi:hypothetical protein